MEKLVDEFFRRKLEEHAFTPSVRAWDKIEASLPKKNKTVIVWRIAAAVALMSGLLWAGLNWQGSKPTELTQIKLNAVTPSESALAKINSTKEAKRQEEEITYAKSRKIIRSVLTTQPQTNQIISEVAETAEIKVLEKIEFESSTIVAAEVPSPITQKPIILEYRLETVKTIAVVHNEEKKGFKGFLNAAKELKNGEDGLGLQTLKDNILAFNFKKEKGKHEEEKNY